MKRTWTLAIILLLAFTMNAFGKKRIAPDLDGLKPGTEVEVIIQFINPAMEKKANPSARAVPRNLPIST